MTYKISNDYVPYDGLVVTYADRLPELLPQPVEEVKKLPLVQVNLVNVEDSGFDIKRGACLGADPNIFYPNKPDLEAKTAKAIGICISCVVVDACLEDALMTREQYGIRGGYTEEERRSILRRRKRDLEKQTAIKIQSKKI